MFPANSFGESAAQGRRGPRLSAALPEGLLQRPRDLLRLSLFVLVVMTISRVHQNFPIIAVLRPGLLLMAASLAFWVIQRESLAGAPALRTWFTGVIAGLAVVACLSAPFGISLGGAARKFVDEYSKVLLLAFFVMLAIRTLDDLWFFVWAYVVGCGVLVLLALLVFKPTMATELDMMRLENLYTYDGNDVCVVLLIGIALALLAFQVARRRWARVLAVAVVLGAAVVVAKSGSRGGFLGAVAVGTALLFTATGVRLSRRLSLLGAASIALALAAPAGYWRQMGTILRPTEDYNWSTETGRREIWTRGMGYMLSYPFAGVGLGNFPRAEGTISERARTRAPDEGIRWVAPHNSFVQVGAELGVTGLALFTSLVLGGFIAMVRLRRRVPRMRAQSPPRERFLVLAPTYFMIAMLGFAVSGFFVSHAYKDHFYILVALIAGLYGIWRQGGGQTPVQGTVGGRFGLAGSVAANDGLGASASATATGRSDGILAQRRGRRAAR